MKNHTTLDCRTINPKLFSNIQPYDPIIIIASLETLNHINDCYYAFQSDLENLGNVTGEILEPNEFLKFMTEFYFDPMNLYDILEKNQSSDIINVFGQDKTNLLYNRFTCSESKTNDLYVQNPAFYIIRHGIYRYFNYSNETYNKAIVELLNRYHMVLIDF